MDDTEKRGLVAQWAYDTRPILGRFHLWLDDVEVQWLRGEPAKEFTRELSFLDGRMERLMAMTGAVTALGTKLFGRFGAGRGLDKVGLNQAKKEADAISAYAMSESLWYLSRQLPENHAIMVCLGEGLMPKGGETPEMGSNPQLGFGRIYARPQVAMWLEERVAQLLNEPDYHWEDFYSALKNAGVTVWGAAIDTLENTSRFAEGAATGPMTVLHLFDQPLIVERPYEGYTGNLILPQVVVQKAEARSVLIDYRTPRRLVVEAIEDAYPGIQRRHIHVWTLGGKSRFMRLENLWREWEQEGAHLVEHGWTLPNGYQVFTDSGTYAPTYLVGTWLDDNGATHLFLCDGYAASAEAMQAASLGYMLGLKASLAVFTSRFLLPHDREMKIMTLDPHSPGFEDCLAQVTGAPVDQATAEHYRAMIREGVEAGLPLGKPVYHADYFFPEKRWRVLAISGYMCPDPYTGSAGVEEISEGVYRCTVRVAGEKGDKLLTFTLRFMEDEPQRKPVFNPLLNRFFWGEDFRTRPVKISDSGRIRNELQTICSEALQYEGDSGVKVVFDRIPPEVISLEHQAILLDALRWYQEHHPLWFRWLQIVPPTGR